MVGIPGPWDYYDNGHLVKSNVDEQTARDIVLINGAAAPGFYIRNHDTGEEVRWADVSDQPWPTHPDDPANSSGDPYFPYGTPPDGWPYEPGA